MKNGPLSSGFQGFRWGKAVVQIGVPLWIMPRFSFIAFKFSFFGFSFQRLNYDVFWHGFIWISYLAFFQLLESIIYVFCQTWAIIGLKTISVLPFSSSQDFNDTNIPEAVNFCFQDVFFLLFRVLLTCSQVHWFYLCSLHSPV